MKLLVPAVPVFFGQAGGAPAVTSSREFDWPYAMGDWAWFGLLAVAIAFTIWICYRDTRRLSVGWWAWLTGLRVAMLAGLAWVAINPHIRTQLESFRPSQVAILVDRSLSMRQPEKTPDASGMGIRSRSEAVVELIESSDLIPTLQKDHHVDLYSFDTDVSESLRRFPYIDPAISRPAAPVAKDPPAPGTKPPAVNYSELLAPTGASTSLGDSLDKLLLELKGSTFSGIVVLSDGVNTSGRDLRSANERAIKQGVRLVTVGVGSTTPPMNLAVARLICPSDVQKSDAFEITALVQGGGLDGQECVVELLQRGADEGVPSVVDTKSVLLQSQAPTEVKFERTPQLAGAFEYTVRARTAQAIVESREDDNEQSRTVNVFDRPLRVLMIAGGPLRDYRFTRALLHRHKSMEVDVWLQTGRAGISQESHELLFEMPKREALFTYDVLLGFDPDWSRITPEEQGWIAEWVSAEGGGMVFIAGDVFTGLLASNVPALETMRKLCPVLIDEQSPILGLTQAGAQPWRIGLTQDGQAADFLRLADDPAASMLAWTEFPGFYRCFPTRGKKSGTTVYAEFTDPLSRGADGQPPLIAGQRYGQGVTLYLGSAEFWRLRSQGEELYDRLWVKFVRKAAEGRSQRGVQRGMFILEGHEFDVGQVVPVRVRVLSEQFQPLAIESLTISATSARGLPLTPAPMLRKDPNRPAEFKGDMRLMEAGRYKLELHVPGLSEPLTEEIVARLPQQEFVNLTQDAPALQALAANTGGAYLTLADAREQLPALLPNRGERVIVDQRIEEIWDRDWLLYLLIGLLTLEWLTRKFLKLA